ncbi:hypothetical protein QQ054_04090 [Oscillatoria amoena NRMC-F 0135]|nr:hypothetical protein [Oscillatoria amoena NRMC-F 0135]
MNVTAHIAKHFREVHFGGNWTWSNLKDNLEGVTWEEAITKVHSFNTIATLVYHTNYYVDAVLKVFKGDVLSANDKFSFSHPPINSQEDWDRMLNKVWDDAREFADLLEQMPDSKLWENIADEKYGIYYRNLHGIIEHTHYHLGQIALIKKILKEG